MHRFFILMLAAMLMACGGSEGTSEAESPGSTGGTSTDDVASGPDESVSSDDPIEDPGPSGAGIECAAEIAIVCDEGFVDGCTIAHEDGSLTSVHICVPASEGPSQPCEQEIARECPEGQVDACSLDPAPSSMHICVVSS